jgi:hypothetical protein
LSSLEISGFYRPTESITSLIALPRQLESLHLSWHTFEGDLDKSAAIKHELLIQRDSLKKIVLESSWLRHQGEVSITVSDFLVPQTLEFLHWQFGCSPLEACLSMFAAPRLQTFTWFFPQNLGCHYYEPNCFRSKHMQWLKEVIEIAHERKFSLRNITIKLDHIDSESTSLDGLLSLERYATIKGVSLKFDFEDLNRQR